MKRLFCCIALALPLLSSWSFATDRFTGEPKGVLRADDARGAEEAKPWALIEHHFDAHPRFPSEPVHPKLVQFYPQTIKALGGTNKPPAGTFALYAAPGFDTAKHPNPVLLIPGANDDATRRYAYPTATTSENHTKVPGLMQYLSDKGFSTFSISFHHYHGDNLFQGEQVANAITRIRQLLGKTEDENFKVDLVTYSKGVMAARAYVQSMGQFYHMKYLTPFRNDVRRIVFQCAPLGGLDTMYRYYMYNLTLANQDVPAPLGASRLMIYGSWKDAGMNHILSGYWRGQTQMVHDQRLIGVADGALSWTTDMNYTAGVLRNGGSSLFLESEGLEAARKAGGNMIEEMNKKGLPASVSAAVVAGTNPVIYDERWDNWKIPLGAELTAPSDGLVYLNSATYTKGLTAQGAKILDVRKFELNHMEISRSADVFSFVAEQLAK